MLNIQPKYLPICLCSLVLIVMDTKINQKLQNKTHELVVAIYSEVVSPVPSNSLRDLWNVLMRYTY